MTTALSQADRARLQYGWGHRAEDLDAYGFTRGTRPARTAEHFLSFHWMRDRARPALNPPITGALTFNKWVFYRVLHGFGIPVPSTLGLYDRMFGVSWDGRRPLRSAAEVVEEVRRQRPRGLVLKANGGTQGRGLLILDEIDEATGRAVTRTGTEITLDAAVAQIDPTGMGDFPGYVVQEPLRVHPLLAHLAPWTTNTIRIVTLVAKDGEVHVQAALTLLGRRGRMANNWHAGGINVAVDLRTGVLGRGVLIDSDEWLTRHPDTGDEFVGVALPLWEETLDVCRRAARLLPGPRWLGWDVVLTPEGPVVLEANTQWDLITSQIHGDGFLADPVIRPQLVDAGAPLPAGSAASLLPRRVARAVRDQLRALRR